MTQSVKSIKRSITLALLLLSGVATAQPLEVEAEPPLAAESTQESNTQPTAELKVTLYPLDRTSNAENDYRRAVLLIQQGRPGAAEVQLRHALSQQDSHLDAREMLVTLLLQRHAVQEAITVLYTGMAVAPNHIGFPLWLAQLHIKLDAPEAAHQVLEKNLTRFSQAPDYLGALASLYQQSGRQMDAHQYFRQAANLAPEDGRWWLGVGMTAESLEDWTVAKSAYRRAKDFSFLDGSLLQFVQQRISFVDAQLDQQHS